MTTQLITSFVKKKKKTKNQNVKANYEVNLMVYVTLMGRVGGDLLRICFVLSFY
jgi:hypothetical protein